MGDTISNVVENTSSKIEMTSVISLIKDATTASFEIAGSAFNFLMANPLCAFMVGSGFAFSALSLVRKGLKVAKRT